MTKSKMNVKILVLQLGRSPGEIAVQLEDIFNNHPNPNVAITPTAHYVVYTVSYMETIEVPDAEN